MRAPRTRVPASDHHPERSQGERPVEEHQRHEAEQRQIGRQPGISPGRRVEAVDVEVAQSERRRSSEQRRDREVDGGEVAVGQHDDPERHPSRSHVGKRVEAGSERTLLGCPAGRPLGHGSVDDIEDESRHQADGGAGELASHRQRGGNEGRGQPGERQEVGGVGHVGDDRRRSITMRSAQGANRARIVRAPRRGACFPPASATQAEPSDRRQASSFPSSP